MYIVTELCTGGELFEKILAIKGFSEVEVALLMKQILSAIAYCHRQRIVHRDMKPENVLFESKEPDAPVKIIDFGTSSVFNPNEKMKRRFGTPYYIAPEVLRGVYDEKCDVWSCGVMTFILLCGYPPFNGANDKAIMQCVLKGQFEFKDPEWSHVSEKAKTFIRKMLTVDATQRYSAEQALNDTFIKETVASQRTDTEINMSALENLRNFNANSKLSKAACLYISNFLATKEEKDAALKVFQMIDINGDGEITREELLEAYEKYLKPKNSAMEVDRLLELIDTNKSGAIDYSEFLMASLDKQNFVQKQRLDAVFAMFDKVEHAFSSESFLSFIRMAVGSSN